MKLNYHKKIMYDYKYGNHSNLCKEVKQIEKDKKEISFDKKEVNFIKKGLSERGKFIETISNRFFRNLN